MLKITLSKTKTKTKTKQNNTGDFKCTMPPDFVIPCNLSTLYRCSLTTLAQDKPYPEKPLIRDCCNLYPIQDIFNHRSQDQLLQFRTSFYKTISSEFQGNFKPLNFQECIYTDRTWTRNLSHPKQAPYWLS